MNEPFGLLLLAVRAAILAGQPEMKCAKVASDGKFGGLDQDDQDTDAPQACPLMHDCRCRQCVLMSPACLLSGMRTPAGFRFPPRFQFAFIKCLVLQALKNIFSNIGSRLVNSNLEDWGLDNSTDLSAGTAEVDKSCPNLSIGAYSFIFGEI